MWPSAVVAVAKAEDPPPADATVASDPSDVDWTTGRPPVGDGGRAVVAAGVVDADVDRTVRDARRASVAAEAHGRGRRGPLLPLPPTLPLLPLPAPPREVTAADARADRDERLRPDIRRGDAAMAVGIVGEQQGGAGEGVGVHVNVEVRTEGEQMEGCGGGGMGRVGRVGGRASGRGRDGRPTNKKKQDGAGKGGGCLGRGGGEGRGASSRHASRRVAGQGGDGGEADRRRSRRAVGKGSGGCR